MFIGQSFAGFQLNDQNIFHKHIGNIFTQNSSIFVINFQRDLLFHLEPCYAQPVCQTVFINFFKVTMPQVAMQSQTRFPDYIA